jgi:peptidoglycan/LPS O-acetylase OafA/YrhL
LGVDVFFVLSGFLITGLLLAERARTNRIRFGQFYARRALRLFPALFVLLAVHLVYAYATGLPWGLEKSGVLSIALYYSNWHLAQTLRVPGDLGALWSLAVEEQFYLVWPLVLVGLLALRRTRYVVAFLVAGIVLVAVHRAQMWRSGVYWLVPYVRTDTRADSLLVGALLAVVWHVGATKKIRGLAFVGTGAAAALVASFFVCTYTGGFLYLGGFTLIAVCVAVVILASLQTNWFGRPFLRNRVLRGFGRVSYGLYLWHLVVFSVVLRYTESWQPLPRVAVAYAISAATTMFSWHFVERPALALKDRFFESGKGSTPVQGAIGQPLRASPASIAPAVRPQDANPNATATRFASQRVGADEPANFRQWPGRSRNSHGRDPRDGTPPDQPPLGRDAP